MEMGGGGGFVLEKTRKYIRSLPSSFVSEFIVGLDLHKQLSSFNAGNRLSWSACWVAKCCATLVDYPWLHVYGLFLHLFIFPFCRPFSCEYTSFSTEYRNVHQLIREISTPI